MNKNTYILAADLNVLISFTQIISLYFKKYKNSCITDKRKISVC